jgi:hypothetical protein
MSFDWDRLLPEPQRGARAVRDLEWATFYGRYAIALVEDGQRRAYADAGKRQLANEAAPKSVPLPPQLETAIMEQSPEQVAVMIREVFPDCRQDALAHAASVREPAFAIHLHTLLATEPSERALPPCAPAVPGSWTEGM